MKNSIEVFDKKETYEFAKNLATKCKGGEIFCLDGDLGVGKTIFAKGFAEGLGIDEEITSPTFSIVNQYLGKKGLKLYHFDVYRIEDIDELFEIGFYEYLEDSEAICLIEWGTLIKSELPKDTHFISIEKDINESENFRKIVIK